MLIETKYNDNIITNCGKVHVTSKKKRHIFSQFLVSVTLTLTIKYILGSSVISSERQFNVQHISKVRSNNFEKHGRYETNIPNFSFKDQQSYSYLDLDLGGIL